MIEYFNLIKKYVPQWAILLFDLMISATALFLAYFLRFNFSIPESYLATLWYVFPIVLTIRLISFLIFKTHAGIIRYTSTRDTGRIFITISLGSVILLIINFLHKTFSSKEIFLIPTSVIFIDLALNVFFLTGIRIVVKALYFESLNINKLLKRVIIYGGDDYGLTTKRALERDPSEGFKVVAFIDHESKGKKIDGITIFDIDKLDELIKKYDVSLVVLAKKRRFPEIEDKVVDISLNNNVRVLRVPYVKNWLDGKDLNIRQIREIKIEDLLERDPIKLDLDKIGEILNGKTVLITGAAGSIGSELVRQVIKFKPKLVVALDHCETPLYELDLEVREKLKFPAIEIVIGDVADKTRMKKLYEVFRPNIVFHAAAYKHVPMMENNPYEAVKTNVLGSKVVIDLAVEYDVEKFIFISTDKAVNPTNVMGASKRIVEMYAQALDKHVKTIFITTRFGNVLGSNGSVIPRFRKQIEEGGPVTVTHPEITRFFMTIPEACQLVLEAAAFGKGSEIFVFDMGKSIKIVDLAKKMIKLAGYRPGIDIEIKFTGLRPGEKLYEELLSDKENTIPTHHPKIMIAKVSADDFQKIKSQVEELIKLLPTHDNYKIVRMMKIIVPEFKSKNSIYEQIDKELKR